MAINNIQRRQRLIEQKHLTLLRQTHRQPRPLPLAAGQRIHRLRGQARHIRLRHRLLNAGNILGRRPLQPALPGKPPQHHQLAHQKIRRIRQFLRQRGNASRPRLRRQRVNRRATEPRRACRQARQNPRQPPRNDAKNRARRFPPTIRALPYPAPPKNRENVIKKV